MSDELILAKSAIETLRSLFGLFKDAKGVLPDSPEKRAIEVSIEASEGQLAVAEAQIAQSLGYTLCRCSFPPTPMLKIGYRDVLDGTRSHADVYECPKCHQDDAGPWAFTRKIGDDTL